MTYVLLIGAQIGFLLIAIGVRMMLARRNRRRRAGWYQRRRAHQFVWEMVMGNRARRRITHIPAGGETIE